MRVPAEQIAALAAEVGLPLGAGEPDALAAIAGELLEQTEQFAAGVAQPDAPLDRGVRAATPQDDPLNAIAAWCDAAPTGDGPLSGRRVSVKESIAVAGVPMGCGFHGLRDFVPTRDSVVVRRLLDAGARVVATTTMDCLGMAAGGETGRHGVTRNPRDPDRTAGGSSSGAAAGLSYSGIDLALGTDQGGSIRVPASWCGLLGLKPTHGLVPYTGAAGIDQGLDHAGPLAATAADLAALLDAIAGADPSDPRQRDISPPPGYAAAAEQAPERLDGLRVGLLAEGFGAAVGVRDDVADASRATAERLADLGARVREVSVPEHLACGPPSLVCNLAGLAAQLSGRATGAGFGGDHWPELTRALAAAVARDAGALSPQVKASWPVGEQLLRRDGGAAYGAAQDERPRLRAGYDRALSEVDVLLLPTTPFPAYAPPADGDVPGLMERGWAMLTNTEQLNFTGHPALSLPTGAVDGLPVGTMLVGRRFEDELLVRIAAVYEGAHGWE